jgi:hypothetical protein
MWKKPEYGLIRNYVAHKPECMAFIGAPSVVAMAGQTASKAGCPIFILLLILQLRFFGAADAAIDQPELSLLGHIGAIQDRRVHPEPAAS